MVVAFVCGERVQQCVLGFRVSFFTYSRSIEEKRVLLLIVSGLVYFPAGVNTIVSVGVLLYPYTPGNGKVERKEKVYPTVLLSKYINIYVAGKVFRVGNT